ncbi:MAG: sigma-E processing peptidase SpoIIGA [Lachnospiraceae bacterium]|nr:sigma-E processing peptidase SpoIIGA [Lachnospiraceae bacterium]
MEIYLDIIFAVNFFMDILIFYITSKLMRRKAKKRKIVLGGFSSAAAYCLYIALPALRHINGIIAGSAMLSLGILIAFGRENFLKSFFLSNICAFAIGGILTSFFFISGTYGIFGKNLSLGIGAYPLWLLITVSSGIYIAIKLFHGKLAAETVYSASYADIKVCIGEKNVFAKALIDTGNSLTEPISGENVIVLELSLLLPFLNTGQLNLDNISFEKAVEIFNEPIKTRLKAVPFKSLGTKCGIMPAFKADRIINQKNGTDIKNAIIGIHGGMFSNDSSYNAILSPKCLKGG